MNDGDDKKKNAENQINELLFTELILSFQAAAWQQMGKVPSMVTGEIDRNLEMAKHSIDILGMFEEKTKGNLSEDESKFLQHALFELRMNYLDELRKGHEPEEKKETPEASDNHGEASESEEKAN
jgi:hypothetical protein